MKTLHELISPADSCWPLLHEWIASAGERAEVLEKNQAIAEETLVELQLSTGTALGAIAWETGGILIDNGWVRVLGSGSARMRGSLSGWNFDPDDPEGTFYPGMMIVAHDVAGGAFALDGGALGEGKGEVFYFSPATLEWQPLSIGYTQLIRFLLTGDLDRFYDGVRWDGWRQEVSKVSPDEGLIYERPRSCHDGTPNPMRAIPIRELLHSEWDHARQRNPESVP